MAQRNTYFQDETVEKDKIDLKNLRRLLLYAAPQKKLFLFTLVIMLLAVIFSMLTPLLLSVIVDEIVPEYKATGSMDFHSECWQNVSVSGPGLGYLIVYGGQVFRLDLVMAATAILCVLAAGMYALVALAEKWLVKK